MDAQTQDRVARNEAAFREVNESIGAGRDSEDDDKLVGFVCECGHADCSRLVELTPFEYEAVRRDPRCFAVLEGHEIPGAEVVVARHARYTVVQKRDVAGAVAEDMDPRS